MVLTDHCGPGITTLVTNALTLNFYNVNKVITLSVDAGSEDIRAVKLQDGQSVAYGSRALIFFQCRYAQTERELLTII